MDIEERTILRDSLSMWCAQNATRLESMEKGSGNAAFWGRLYEEIDALGVLHILADANTRHDIATVAEAANCLAAHSPSLALLVVQQNLAARLLGDTGADQPVGWVALPLYDSAVEWPRQVRVVTTDAGYLVDGCWGSIPGLPIASSALLPLASAENAQFALVRLELASLPAGVERDQAARTLGLRGCPISDLTCRGAVVSRSAILAEGTQARRAVESLWSQAEVLMLAIRAGILERSYAVARNHAALRWQGKKIIIEHSMVRQMLADLYGAKCAIEESWRGMSTALVASEPLTAGQMSMSLHFAAALPRLASDGIQLLGGYGYVEEFGQERLFRDAKQCEMLLGHPQAKRLSIWRREPC
jgi:hypothetical protein